MSVATHTLAGRTDHWPTFPHAIVQRMKAIIASLAAERRRRQAICGLQTFDDRTLADIGLTRGDIDNAVRFGRSQTGMVFGAYDSVVQPRSRHAEAQPRRS